MTLRLLPILYYHHVGIHLEPKGHQTLWISRENFEAQMAYLVQAGYHCLSLQEARFILKGRARVPRRTVVLTFDDGYENFYDSAYPILTRYGFHATVFVVTGQVGKVSFWDPGVASKLMDWVQLREINQRGIEVGSHTATHPKLTQLPPGSAMHELNSSRDALQQHLGMPVSSFAYPYGDWNSLVAQWVEESGYGAACSIVRGNLHRPEELYCLKRIPVGQVTDLSSFRRRLSPIYDITNRVRRLTRRLSGRI